MLTIHAKPYSFCDRITRRQAITIGGAGCMGLSLPTLLRAEQAQGRVSDRALILVHLDGGPPQHETIDPKPDAPAEIRGEFSTIPTSLPGVHIGELLPRLASRMQDFTLIRSLTGSVGSHDAFQCQSGFPAKELQSLGGRPAVGCVISRLLGDSADEVPSFIDMMQGRALVRNSARPGFLGPAYQPFRPDLSQMFERELEAGMKSELSRLGENHATSLELNAELTVSRVDQRLQLLAGLDQFRREIDHSGMMSALDEFQQQAVSILMSGKLAEALDLNREDPAVLESYTLPERAGGERSTTSESADSVKKFLLARRLVEAGVRVVSLSISDFDTHSHNFPRMQHLLPIVDFGLTRLIEDLRQRGLLDQVTVVAWGEFGRTPRINSKGGRDHWPKVGPAILAGGGLRTGQVIGQTDRLGASVIDRPITYKDMFATLYRSLGLDPFRITLDDPQGRPQYLLDEGQVISELI